ncbi:MAG: recombination mediator RecR [Waddliaceae bacterium]
MMTISRASGKLGFATFLDEMRYPKHLLHLIETLKRLPGVGNKSAERFAFQMIEWKTEHLKELANLLKTIPDKLKSCDECGCLTGEDECRFCDSSRDSSVGMCIIASPRDAFAIEETREYKGLYHVLGGLLSPLDGRGPEYLNFQKMKNRITSRNIREVIIALDSTLEGDATALYLKKELADLPIHISRLAFGLPIGSSLDYVDGGTLTHALAGRAPF